jgi:hypothetical protein
MEGGQIDTGTGMDLRERLQQALGTQYTIDRELFVSDPLMEPFRKHHRGVAMLKQMGLANRRVSSAR